MSDAIVDVAGDEAKRTMLEFMGQTLGSLSEIDKLTTNKTNQLRGLTIDPREVLNSIPGSSAVHHPPVTSPGPVVGNIVLPPPEVIRTAPPPGPSFVSTPAPVAPTPSKDQLEFSFKPTDLKQVMDTLDHLLTKVKRQEKLLEKIASDQEKLLAKLLSKSELENLKSSKSEKKT